MGEKWQRNIPDEETIVGTHKSLVRLIRLYRIDLQQLAENGKIRKISAADHLTAEDFRNLAIAALGDAHFRTAGQLVDMAIEMNNSAPWLREMMRLRTVASYGSKEKHTSNYDCEYIIYLTINN